MCEGLCTCIPSVERCRRVPLARRLCSVGRPPALPPPQRPSETVNKQHTNTCWPCQHSRAHKHSYNCTPGKRLTTHNTYYYCRQGKIYIVLQPRRHFPLRGLASKTREQWKSLWKEDSPLTHRLTLALQRDDIRVQKACSESRTRESSDDTRRNSSSLQWRGTHTHTALMTL